MTHDGGKFFLTVRTYSKKAAIHMVMEAENCPRSAMELISTTKTTLR